MSLRCLLFSSDEGTAAPILQVLTGLGVAGEHCSEAVATVEKVTHENFQRLANARRLSGRLPWRL
jgi:hypothetical protein